jgi:hypothetical protein
MTTWDEADHVRIPLLDGTFGTGQIAGLDGANPILLLTLRQSATPDAPMTPIGASEMVALLRTSDSAIQDGLWTIPGFEALPRPRDLLSRIYAPVTIHDPAMIEAFLNACHGLIGWHSFPDKTTFDEMLYQKIKRPASARSGK